MTNSEANSEAALFFDQTHAPVGFTNPALSQFDGSPEPVVRELLQNSVDAADRAGRSGEVVFRIIEVGAEELPGWKQYKGAFEGAVADRKRKGKTPTHDEATIIARIREAMEDPVRLLLCIDNGTGIPPARMEALLTPGNSDKGDGGAGSFGLGHYAAFAASNLHYILYASRYRNKKDEVETVSTGHAILATHPKDDGKAIRAADGYLLVPGQGEFLFADGYSRYLRDVPPVLKKLISELDDTGTIVCITGFNDFNRDEDGPSIVDSISRIAAANFCQAIFSGQLKIRVETEDSNE